MSENVKNIDDDALHDVMTCPYVFFFYSLAREGFIASQPTHKLSKPGVLYVGLMYPLGKNLTICHDDDDKET